MSPNQFGHESINLGTGQSVKFHWERSAITKRLISAVGIITLEWAMIDPQITEMVRIFWLIDRPTEKIPRSFDKRSNILREYADALYTNERDEWLLFRWYLHRLKDANGRRDAIAHGLPGNIMRHGRTYRGLMVPYPSKSTNFVPMTTDEIVALADTMTHLNVETHQVSTALSEAHWAAQAASSRGKLSRHIDGKWTHVTLENRSPRLPKTVPLPPTFQG